MPVVLPFAISVGFAAFLMTALRYWQDQALQIAGLRSEAQSRARRSLARLGALVRGGVWYFLFLYGLGIVSLVAPVSPQLFVIAFAVTGLIFGGVLRTISQSVN